MPYAKLWKLWMPGVDSPYPADLYVFQPYR